MSIDDRIRAATEATAATVREIRPLTLPRPSAAPARPRRRSAAPARPGWLVPLAAAVAVIVVAAILVAVRDVPGIGHASATTPASQGQLPAALPRYGVVLTEAGEGGIQYVQLERHRHSRRPAGGPGRRTRQAVSFAGVSGAADDRTFAVSAVSTTAQRLPGTTQTQSAWSWYLLRIAPGSAQPVTLTKLAIPPQPQDAVIYGFALSPDGRTLAVLEWLTVPGPWYKGSPGTLQLYSVATGKALRVWQWGKSPDPIDPVPRYGRSIGLDLNSAGLTWLADGRTLAFTYYAHGQAPVVRTLDTSRPGE